VSEAVPAATEPWYSSQHGWMVGGLPVSWWGCAVQPPELPERWQSGPDGSGQIEPTDFESECWVHLAKHEQARLGKSPLCACELDLLSDCVGFAEPVPAEAVTAAADGHTLVGFCPGISWFWRDENRTPAFNKKL
jgi:hypothetical protein